MYVHCSRRTVSLIPPQIGQAVRLAVAMGMNREMPPDDTDPREHERRRRLWWTLYIIDRKISIMVGAPVSIKDDEIDISAPSTTDLGLDNTAFNLHIGLAKLEGQVISGTKNLSIMP